MSRWRPPSPKSSPYITREGYVRLELELKELWRRRGEVVQALSTAAAEGDRSENAEYIYRKKQLREMDQRIGYLQQRMPKLRVISESPPDKHHVFFGAWVTVEDENGQEIRYHIVGTDELDPTKGHISVDSPLACALLKRAPDDKICLLTPEGKVRYFITEVYYANDTGN